MDAKPNPLRIQGIFLLVALVVQYAIGMYVDLFVPFPENTVGFSLWKFAWSNATIAAHIVLGILILIGAIVILIRSVIVKDRQWITVSIVGLLGVMVAGVSGSIFVPTQANVYSYFMSVAFLVTFLAYAWGVFGAKRAPLNQVAN